MAKIPRNQKDYLKACEELDSQGMSASGIINLSEVHYGIKCELAEYKHDPFKKAKDYPRRIDGCYKYMLTSFFRIDAASPIYKNFQKVFSIAYLDNTDDDTNDYADETMIKLNKIYDFINSLGDQDLEGIELLTLLRDEMSSEEDEKKPLHDLYFDISFREIKSKCDEMAIASIDEKMQMVDGILLDIADMEDHLFRKKLYEKDYRKSVTGLVNYLFARAGIPEIYIKPIELDEYYWHVSRADSIDNSNLVTFYKEKICDSIAELLIAPMKESIKYALDTEAKYESGELDNPIVSLRQNKYK